MRLGQGVAYHHAWLSSFLLLQSYCVGSQSVSIRILTPTSRIGYLEVIQLVRLYIERSIFVFTAKKKEINPAITLYLNEKNSPPLPFSIFFIFFYLR